MKLAIMQPYLFPYIGYFQLIAAADKLVLYDDVNYIKGGWINRNNILVNGKKQLFTLQLHGASSFKHIHEIEVGQNAAKIIKTIEQAYSKAPFFEAVFPFVQKILQAATPPKNIAQVAAQSIIQVCKYLGIHTTFEFSSEKYSNTQHLKGQNRLFEICKQNNVHTYINTIAGESLYSKKEFYENDIQLFFLKTLPISYNQSTKNFVPYLSIIDVLMYNAPEKANELLTKYELI